MSVIATDSTRFSAVVKHEYEPSKSFCRDAVTLNGAAATYKVGAVLGKYIATPTATSAAKAGNTGNGAMGAITMTSVANLKTGAYKVSIVKAAANAGDFVLKDSEGDVLGTGTVGVAFSQAGFAFTLADGATDFVVGDEFTITVAGTVKYKIVEATATDGSEVAAAVLIADSLGQSGDIVLAATTDTKALALTRGPVIVADAGLTFGASVDTAGELATAYAQLKSVGITVDTAA
jgi:hypothetical protein